MSVLGNGIAAAGAAVMMTMFAATICDGKPSRVLQPVNSLPPWSNDLWWQRDDDMDWVKKGIDPFNRKRGNRE